MHKKQINWLLFGLTIAVLSVFSSCATEEVSDIENKAVDANQRLNRKASLFKDGANLSMEESISAKDLFFKNYDNKVKIEFSKDIEQDLFLKNGEDQGQKVSIPDPAFEQALIDLGVDDVEDGLVFKNNVKKITLLDVSNRGISDLTGIEHFVKLVELNCSFNQITNLDFNKNIKLETLICRSQFLTSIDIGKNKALRILDLSGVGFNELGHLTNLDVTKNVNLRELSTQLNQLESIDLSQNKLLEIYWGSINPYTSFDASHNPLIKQLLIGGGQFSSVDLSHNPALEWLSIFNGQVTNLDLSHNPALKNLVVGNNPLTNLDVRGNPELELLYCSNTLINSLDVSANPVLMSVIAFNASLTSLNVKNGNNINLSIMAASGNPDLTCIQVDDVAYSEATWEKDLCAQFSEDCSVPPVFCASDLSGTHSYVSTNLQNETGTCPTGDVIGTVIWTKICGNAYAVSDLYFGMNASSCWDDIPMPSVNEGFVLSNDDCNLLRSGFLDIYYFNVTLTITGVSGPELYISWENNYAEYGGLVNDSGDVVITREGGLDWPPLFTQ